MPSPERSEVATCALCGTALAGPYCQNCGQASAAAPRSFREVFLGQTGRLAHTFRLLFMRPGELAREIEEGRDRGSMRPLTLLLNLIAFFFLVGAPGNFTVGSLAAQDSSGRVQAEIDRRVARTGIPRELVVERLDRRFQSAYSLVIPWSAVVYACVLWLLHLRSHRRRWLTHLAAAIHFLAFIFITAAILLLIGRLVHFNALREPVAVAALLLLNFGYLAAMLRRAYDDSWLAAAGKSVIVMAVGTLSDNLLLLVALAVTMASV